jgi:hypothetical protein
MNRYELFVIFHKGLKEEYYNESLISNYTFVNVNRNNEQRATYPDYRIINQFDFKDFYSLGKWYTESEVIYNIFKNDYLYKDLEYLGFLQHDIDSSILTESILDDLLSGRQHINFQPYLFDEDYNQKILMDPRSPEKRVGSGINCYDVILNDYNAFYHTDFKIDDLKGRTVNLCSSFLIRKDLFVEMMRFVVPIIEAGKLDKFDTKHKYRVQGGYLERYYAVWLALQNLESAELRLTHYFDESVKTIKMESWTNKMLVKIGILR